MIAGCGEQLSRTSLITNEPSAPSELRQACALTEQRCTRCHTLGRVLSIDTYSREQWEPVVERMRRMTSSGITRDDATVVVTCLTSRR